MQNYKQVFMLNIFLAFPLISAEKIHFKNWATMFLQESSTNSELLTLFLQERKNRAQEILKQEAISCKSPVSPHTPRSPVNVKQQTPKIYCKQQPNLLHQELLVLRAQETQEKYHKIYCALLLQMFHISKLLSDEIDQIRSIELSKKFAEAILEVLALPK